jgi:hypothetical protein
VWSTSTYSSSRPVAGFSPVQGLARIMRASSRASAPMTSPRCVRKLWSASLLCGRRYVSASYLGHRWRRAQTVSGRDGRGKSRHHVLVELTNTQSPSAQKSTYGDVYGSSGALSGDTRREAARHSPRCRACSRRNGEACRRLCMLEAAECMGRDGREKWKGLAKELEIKKREMRLFKERVAGSNAMREGAFSLSISASTAFRMRCELKVRCPLFIQPGGPHRPRRTYPSRVIQKRAVVVKTVEGVAGRDLGPESAEICSATSCRRFLGRWEFRDGMASLGNLANNYQAGISS